MSEFMLLIYSDPKAWADSPEVQAGTVTEEYMAYTESLVASGEHRGGAQLQPVTTARTIAQDGVVTDGPFAETTEVLGGYYLVDVPDIEAAIEWAGKIPGVLHGLDRVEVRALVERPRP